MTDIPPDDYDAQERAAFADDAAHSKTNGAAAPPVDFAEGPTADAPLRGLEHLSKVAVIGRDRIVELAERPIVWLWENIATAGLTVLLAAGPGSGKTTLLFLLIAGRANMGEPVEVLGYEVTPAPPGKWIVIIENEHSDESSARILRKSCHLQGIGEAALERVILVARGSVKIGSPAWTDVEKLIAAGLVSDVILDTLARCAPSNDDANSESEQVAIFDRIAQSIELARAPADRPTFWVAAHLRKYDGVPTLADVSGSTQRAGQADVVLLLGAVRETSGQRVTSVKCAFGKVREKDAEDWPALVEYVVRKSGVALTDAPPNDPRPLEEQILSRLKLGPKTKTELARELGLDRKTLQPAVDALFAADPRRIQGADVIVKAGKGGKGTRVVAGLALAGSEQ
jgi:hypothetical protein